MRRLVALASLALLVALGLGGCAQSRAPGGFLPGSARGAALSAHGAWIVLGLPEGQAEGELLAASADSVYVLPPLAPRRAYGRAGVTRLHLELHRGGVPAASTITGLGTLSTLSHGLALVLSAPAWLLGGGAAIGSASRTGMRRSPGLRWEGLPVYARYPQGLPPGLPPGAR